MVSTSPTLKRKAADLAEAEHKKPKQNASITSFFGTPKPKAPTATTTTATTISPDGKVTTTATVATSTTGAASATVTTPAFNKDTWAASLTPDQRSLLRLELDTLDPTWLAALHKDLLSPSFLSLKTFLRTEHAKGAKIFPPAPDVYAWSRHTPLPSVRAVILGQDPYHNDNQAHGLCFSVRPPTPAPPSLKNMYIALAADYPSFKPPANKGGDLTPWADSGVLLLNTCLTVRAHEANSHAGKGWEQFTQRVIEVVAKQRKDGVVFLAWGSPAQKRVVGIAGRHLVLKSVHPSPLSARRGFFECGHFKKANEFLRGRYGAEGEIDWSLDRKAKKVEEPVKLEQRSGKGDGGEGKVVDDAEGQGIEAAKILEAEAEEKIDGEP